MELHKPKQGHSGGFLDTIPQPVDPLIGWSTTRDVPHLLQANQVGVAAIPSIASYSFASPNGGAEPGYARQTGAADRVARAGGQAASRICQRDRAAGVRHARSRRASRRVPSGGDVSEQRIRPGAAGGRGRHGRRHRHADFFVQTGGYDTHAGQNTNQANGTYTQLMGTLNDGLTAFYGDLLRQGLLGDTMVLQFSEFGRRINENGSAGTDHGAASVMMVIGGGVSGGIYGTAPNLRRGPGQSHAREQRQRRALRDRLPIRLRARDRSVAGWRFRQGAGRGFQEWSAAVRVTLSVFSPSSLVLGPYSRVLGPVLILVLRPLSSDVPS